MRRWAFMVLAIVCVVSLVCVVSAGAFAQARRPQLEPLPEPLPPPSISGADEPGVRIPVQKADKVEEIHQGGRVVMLKVTPPGGSPYFLVDTTGNGNWMRRDSLDDGLRAPMWPVYTFD
jgi:hypothetical protein